MIVTAFADQKDEYHDLFDQMFRLRARQFSERRRWRVTVKGGKEIDQFDDLNPIYICAVNEDGRLIASLRLLPSVGPHMLADVFPEVMNGKDFIRRHDVWESSRFCVDTFATTGFGPDGIHRATKEVLFGLFDLAQKMGITKIVSVYDLSVERILRRSGCQFKRLGPPHKFNNSYTVGGLFDVTTKVVDALRPTKSVLHATQFQPNAEGRNRNLLTRSVEPSR